MSRKTSFPSADEFREAREVLQKGFVKNPTLCDYREHRAADAVVDIMGAEILKGQFEQSFFGEIWHEDAVIRLVDNHEAEIKRIGRLFMKFGLADPAQDGFAWAPRTTLLRMLDRCLQAENGSVSIASAKPATIMQTLLKIADRLDFTFKAWSALGQCSRIRANHALRRLVVQTIARCGS